MAPNDYTLPTQPGFYSRPSIYPDMAWMLDRRGDWWLVTMSGRAENRGRTGPIEAAGTLQRLVLIREGYSAADVEAAAYAMTPHRERGYWDDPMGKHNREWATTARRIRRTYRGLARIALSVTKGAHR